MAMGPSMDFKTVLIALFLTMLCGAVGLCFYLRYELGKVRGESFAKRMDGALHKIFDELEYRLGWGIWDESRAETMEQRRRRYMDSEMCEVSDDEYWRSSHYGPMTSESPGLADEQGEESSLSDDTMVRCADISPELRRTLLETNELLRTRIQRLECEWDEAEIQNDLRAMEPIEDQIREATAMMYSGLGD